MAVDGLEIEGLLAPIPGEAPAGADLRADYSPTSLYFRLRDARADARAAERAADADPDAETGLADGWRQVRALAASALAEQSKDLEIAAWLTEALVRSHGLAGLAFGAELLCALADRYWAEVFPRPDEDGLVTRLAPITGLNGEGGDGTLMQPLRKLPLFPALDGGSIRLFQFEQSAELATLADSKRAESRVKAGVKPFEQAESEARAAGAAHFAALRAQARAALSAWQAMGEALDRLAGPDSPPSGRVREILARVVEIAVRYAPPEQIEGEGAAAAGDGSADAGQSSGPGGPRKVATREDALRTLAELADFFRRTEPHSPLSYTIDEAIRRARLTWPELLAEVVSDDGVRRNILFGLGIKP